MKATPNRIIKESICTSETVDQMSWFEEAFFYRLIVNCDDFGRFDARPAVLKARLFPLKERVTIKEVSNALTRLAELGIVRLYVCDSKPYLYLPTWSVHQSPRAKASKFPAPEDGEEQHACTCKQMHADAPDIRYSRTDIREPIFDTRESGEKTRARRFTPPTLAEVQSYVAERHSPVDPQGFIDFYASKGWMVGKTPMKDWKAACRNAEKWERWSRNSAGSGNVFAEIAREEGLF